MDRNNHELIKIVSRAAEYLCKESQFGRWLDPRTDATSIWALNNCGMLIKDKRFLRYCVMELFEDATRDEDGVRWNEEIWDTSVCAIAIKNATGSLHRIRLQQIKMWLIDELAYTKDNFRNEPWESLWALFALLHTVPLTQKTTKIAQDCLKWILSKRDQRGVLISPHYVGLLLSVLGMMLEKLKLNKKESKLYKDVINKNIDYLIDEFEKHLKGKHLWSDEPWSNGLILHGIAFCYKHDNRLFFNSKFNNFLVKWCNTAWNKLQCWQDTTDTSGMLIGLSEYCINRILIEKGDKQNIKREVLREISSLVNFEFKESSSRRMVVYPLWRGRQIMPKSKQLCLLMPFMEEWSASVHKELKTICEKSGYSLKRADDMDDREVAEGIWRLINESRIAIADCTGRNVNVFYEIGMAHTLGKDVILLCQNAIDDIPIDIRTQRVIEYSIKNCKKELFVKLPALIDNIIAGRV